jgi:hypothetical protein
VAQLQSLSTLGLDVRCLVSSVAFVKEITCFFHSIPQVSLAIQLAQEAEKRFIRLTAGSPDECAQLMSLRYQKELNRGKKDVQMIDDAILAMSEMWNTLQTGTNAVWEEHGCSMEWMRLDTLAKRVLRVVGQLKEVWCDVV